MPHFIAPLGRPDPQPAISNTFVPHDDSGACDIGTRTRDCDLGTHNTRVITLHEPLPIPTATDLSKFWPPDSPGRLYGPLDLANPFHRDALWSQIANEIEISDAWMDLLDRRSERGEYHPAHYLALKTEATKLRSFKRRCLQVLKDMERAR